MFFAAAPRFVYAMVPPVAYADAVCHAC